MRPRGRRPVGSRWRSGGGEGGGSSGDGGRRAGWRRDGSRGAGTGGSGKSDTWVSSVDASKVSAGWTHRKDDSLEISDVDDKACRSSDGKKREQVWRDEGDGRHLARSRGRGQLELTKVRAQHLAWSELTWRSSNKHRASISLIRVGIRGFSSTISLRDFGSVMRCLQQSRDTSNVQVSSDLIPPDER